MYMLSPQQFAFKGENGARTTAIKNQICQQKCSSKYLLPQRSERKK